MGVVDKAVAVLSQLEVGPAHLVELMRRTGLPRATAHRLALALEAHGMVDRDETGAFRLGPRLVEMGRAAAGARHRSLAETALPLLGRLRDETGESAQLYVRSGDGRARVCVAALESPHGLRTIVAVGAVLPIDRGSAGRVLSRSQGTAEEAWAESVEEREVGVASVSAPVVVRGEVVAAISVSGPIERTSRRPAERYAAPVVAAAADLAARLEAFSS